MSNSEKRKRTQFIQVRVTPVEKAQFLERCEASGLSTGDYIRIKCLDEKPLRAVRKVRANGALITQAIHQLARYGNSLNQVARKFNEKVWITDQDRKAMRLAMAIMVELRTTFRQALGYDS